MQNLGHKKLAGDHQCTLNGSLETILSCRTDFLVVLNY